MSETHTREQYLNGESTHEEYYAQFVTPSEVIWIGDKLGKRLLASSDPHLNDIDLYVWDSLPYKFEERFLDLGDIPSQAGHVCCWKEAARQWLKG